MKQTVYLSQFKDVFRATRALNFSNAGLTALYEYLEEYEESTGMQIELDVIGLCCEFSEYDNLAEFQLDYGHEEYPDMESIEHCTCVIPFGSESFLITQF